MKYRNHWIRIEDLVDQSTDDLISTIESYINVLSSSQHDTYTNPFEIVALNMGKKYTFCIFYYYNKICSVLGLDLITPESLYGYESETIPIPIFPGDHTFTTERVILPDTSNFLEHPPAFVASPGPLVSFPKYNNYLQDKTKFDQHSRILVPLKLLGIKPIDKGELITKHTLSETGAVVSYAQYKQAGMLFPEVYDASVVRRWGVDITIGSPLISVSILVPEYVDAIENPLYHRPVVFDETNLDTPQQVLKKMFMETEVQLHENDAARKSRSVSKKLFFKSLTGKILSLPVRLQIWLDSNNTVFNERSNPQCVHWSTARGWVVLKNVMSFVIENFVFAAMVNGRGLVVEQNWTKTGLYTAKMGLF